MQTLKRISIFQEAIGVQVNAHEDGCFKFLGEESNSTWFEAMLACEKEGGYLAEPKTLRQMEFLTGLVQLEAEFYGPR